ncbi:hypothetical protein FALCPG4_008658 [Fusarium falciforme]
MVSNKALYFEEVPTGVPVPGQHLKIKQLEFDLAAAPTPGGFAGQVLYASFDPYLRHLLVAPENARDGFEPLPVGNAVPNTVITKVLKSDTPNFQPGDVVIGFAPIQEYITVDSNQLAAFRKLENSLGLGLQVYLGALGMAGLTGYSALYEIGKPKAGETIFISAASGAVGQIVAQLAKKEGLKVIGSVGSDEKVQLLQSFGFHGVFNYRTTDPDRELKQLAPNGIDIYYDNVGGRQLEVAISHMRDHGRIIACGYASQYNIPPEQQYGIRNTSMVIGKRLVWRGLSVFDEDMGDKYRQEHQDKVGKLIVDKTLEVVMSGTLGIDNAASGLVDLFEGRNVGKAFLNFGVKA